MAAAKPGNLVQSAQPAGSSTGERIGVGELSIFCQSYSNKTLIGQAGSIGGSTRQEVEAGQ